MQDRLAGIRPDPQCRETDPWVNMRAGVGALFHSGRIQGVRCLAAQSSCHTDDAKKELRYRHQRQVLGTHRPPRLLRIPSRKIRFGKAWSPLKMEKPPSALAARGFRLILVLLLYGVLWESD